MDWINSASNRITSGSLSWLEFNPHGSRLIILLHGLGATSESWMLQVPDLIQAGYRILCPDIPGFGQSGWPAEPWNIRVVTDILARWMQSAAGKPADVAGLSMGGVFAQQICLDYPDLVERLVLINTFARITAARPAQWLYFSRRMLLVALFGLKPQANLVAQHIFPGEEQKLYREELVRQILQSDEKAYRRALQSLGLVNIEKRLPEIKKPVLVISAKNDTTVPLQVQARLVARISGARQVIIEGAGHAVIVDQPEIFNRALLDFLGPA